MPTTWLLGRKSDNWVLPLPLKSPVGGRVATGQWLVRGISETVYGAPTDMPQPGDYDGDGRTDPTVFSPNPGSWTINQSTSGLATSSLGIVGDVVTSLVGVVSTLTGLFG